MGVGDRVHVHHVADVGVAVGVAACGGDEGGGGLCCVGVVLLSGGVDVGVGGENGGEGGVQGGQVFAEGGVGDGVEVGVGVVAVGVEFVAEGGEGGCVDVVGQGCFLVVVLEGVDDVGAAVGEVDDEHVVLAEVVGGAVEAGQGLDGVDALEGLVEVQGAQEGLVEPGLVLVGDDEEPFGGLFEQGGRVTGARVGVVVVLVGVELGFGDLVAVVGDVAGEGDQYAVGAVAVRTWCVPAG